MTSPEVLQKTPDLTDPGCNNFVKVDPGTLRHVKFPNIFSLGDCSTLPTSKTAAAAGAFFSNKDQPFHKPPSEGQ